MYNACLERLPLKSPGNSVVLTISLPWKMTANTYECEARPFVVISNSWWASATKQLKPECKCARWREAHCPLHPGYFHGALHPVRMKSQDPSCVTQKETAMLAFFINKWFTRGLLLWWGSTKVSSWNNVTQQKRGLLMNNITRVINELLFSDFSPHVPPTEQWSAWHLKHSAVPSVAVTSCAEHRVIWH